MTTHTPGPWRAEPYKYGPTFAEFNRVSILASHYSRPGVVSGQDSICECHGAGSPAEQLANARLIAAAPELLAACLTFVEWLTRENSGGEGQPWREQRGTPAGETAWREWYDQNLRLCDLAQTLARAAIAKVEGKE
jgi:hypothetical protein